MQQQQQTKFEAGEQAGRCADTGIAWMQATLPQAQ